MRRPAGSARGAARPRRWPPCASSGRACAARPAGSTRASTILLLPVVGTTVGAPPSIDHDQVVRARVRQRGLDARPLKRGGDGRCPATRSAGPRGRACRTGRGSGSWPASRRRLRVRCREGGRRLPEPPSPPSPPSLPLSPARGPASSSGPVDPASCDPEESTPGVPTPLPPDPGLPVEQAHAVASASASQPSPHPFEEPTTFEL